MDLSAKSYSVEALFLINCKNKFKYIFHVDVISFYNFLSTII